jgi:general secretion pathway protein C
MRSTLPIPGARKLLLCLYLGLSTFLAAHIVNAFVADALRMPDRLPPPLPSQDNAIQRSMPPLQQLAQDMMTRGLFALPAESTQDAGSSTGAGLGPPLGVANKLLLHGTALGIGDEPVAIIQDRSNQQQKLLHLHDRVLNVGELISIEKTRVLFHDRGREEWLELAMLTDLEQARRIPSPLVASQGRPLAINQPARSTPPTDLTPVASPTSGVSSPSSSRSPQIIDRRELSKTLSDIPHLLLQGQPVVSMTDGRFNGILLEAVRFDGWYYKMGLQSGDVLKRINGMELREPSMVITALEQMKDERSVKLDIVRNKTPRTLTYEIR